MRLLLLAAACAASLCGQDSQGLKIEKFVGGFRFLEGPVWSAEGSLIFSDVPANVIFRVKPGEPAVPLREDAGGASGNAFDTKGRLYTCETRARRVVRADKGKLEVLADRFEGKRLNAPNDLAVRKDGHVYFTDPAFGYQSDTRELDFYGVYHLTNKGELKLVAKPAGRPNGIALSPNGRILYVANSDERNVRAYDLDGKGEASAERIFIARTEGIPNGLRTDEKGNLYVAADTVVIYSPAGQPARTIVVPEKPSGFAFGDADGKSLYITARGSVYRVRLEEPRQ